MMKKRLVLAMALLMCVFVLSGCQSNSNSRYTPVTTTAAPAGQATQNLSMAPT